MAKTCLFSPLAMDGKPYRELPVYRHNLGSKTGTKAFLKALSPGFQERNKGRLEIDSQGVATYESAMGTSDMRDFVGFRKIKESLERKYGFTEVPNTSDNFRMLVNQAKAFNDANGDYIAYPERKGDNIANVVHRKDKDSIDAFNNVYGSMLLNDRLLEIFSPLGLTVGELTAAEKGYSGIVDFNNAKAIAGEFSNLIRVSNNMQGQLSMSEEFSHLIVRMLRDNTLMQRVLDTLVQNQARMREILGEDFNQYAEAYTDEDGNVNYYAIAEECAGRILQNELLGTTIENTDDSYLEKLWKRLVNAIKRIFKDYDYTAVDQAVLDADQTMSTLAKNLLQGTIDFTKEDIEDTLPEVQREMEEIKAKAIANGTFMKAPNGKKSNLTERQWLQVRTKNFINWFGDWINDPTNASKIVDENGEPLVVYHSNNWDYQHPYSDLNTFELDSRPNRYQVGLSYDDFNNLNKERLSRLLSQNYITFNPDYVVLTKSAHQTKEDRKDNLEAALLHAKPYLHKIKQDLNNVVVYSPSVFMNNIVETDAAPELETDPKYEGITRTYFTTRDNLSYSRQFGENAEAVFLNIKNPFNAETASKEDREKYLRNNDFGTNNIKGFKLKRDGYDGAMDYTSFRPEYVVFNPNQIKSATDNNGGFSKTNPDIMYHLEKDIDELDRIIEDRINVETKKTKIIKNERAVEAANRKIENLRALIDGTPEGKLKGIINYAHNAVYDLGASREALGKSKSGNRNFSMLRGIRASIQSYDDFIHQLSSLINTDNEELEKLVAETSIEDKHHTVVKMRQAYGELTSLYDLVKDDFKKILLDSVEEFFKPFFNVENGKFVDGSGKERSLRELIEVANGDIGFTDRYLMTMSSSGDLMLQLFDAVVSKAKADARYSTINDLNDITRIMLDAEEKGITSFDWVYERGRDDRKTGNYISAVNTGQYERDKEEFLRKLDEEYGINPSGAKAKEKKAKRKEWLSIHGKNHGTKPNEGIYRNAEFDRLSAAQKEVLGEIMKMKQKLDRRLPSNKVAITKAIQMRRTSQQRLLNSMSNPRQAFNNIQESIAKEFTLTNDDDQIYGVKTGLRSFDGSEFKVLPALYTTRLSDPEELTDDIFSGLAAYSYSTNVYHEMDKVVDPLELAQAWVREGREIKEMSNGKELVEKVNGVVNPILKKGGSYIVTKLDDFMDSQVYGRYYADSDKTINVMGKELKAGKMVNKWLSLSSAVQLGFNALSQLGNLATGVAMQNIEALCGHYFSAKELFNADAQYLSEIPKFLSEVESRNPTGKLALFDQLFDIKQEFADNTKRRMNTLFEKLFGKTVAYLGQTCGDHWLYNRTAIAMCLRKKVRMGDGTVTSLWEALKVVDAFSGDDRVKKLTIDAVDADTGQIIDMAYIHEMSDRINKINHRLFGVYNTDDMVAAQRVALGRAVLQYRQWMVPMFARRFQEREYNLSLGEYEEGYYRTLLRVAAGLRSGMHGVMEVWDDLDEAGKRNVYRALIEMSQFMLVWAVANFLQFGKGDPDRSWGMKLAEYMAQRELHELGNLTPSFTMGNEILKTVKSPATILNTTQAAMNLAASLLDPRDWNDEIESGKYEGMSTLHKNILKAPFPILAPFNQLDRFTDSLEEVTRYYARPY